MPWHGVSEIDVQLGRALSTFRNEAGWSTDRLSIIMGLSSTDLTDAEAGTRRLTASQIMAAAQALRFSPKDLYSRVAPPGP